MCADSSFCSAGGGSCTVCCWTELGCTLAVAAAVASCLAFAVASVAETSSWAAKSLYLK